MQRQLARLGLYGAGRVAQFALAAALTLAAIVPGRASATSLDVCSSGCPFTTIAAALDAATDGDKIRIATGTYAGGFTIEKNVSLLGAGAELTTISGGGTVVTVAFAWSATIRGVTITGGTGVPGGGIRNEGTLTLEETTISNNNASCCGAGIANLGMLTLRKSTVSGNTADGHAGGIDNTSGTVMLEQSTVSGNTAVGGGAGGIQNLDGGTVTLKQSTVSGNTALRIGGGINNTATLTLDKSTVSGNTSTNEHGGGIGNGGMLTLRNSTVSANTAPGFGGGIANGSGGRVELEKSTVSGNTANGGGGIYNVGPLTLRNSSVTGNTATRVDLNFGGGILNDNDGGTVTLDKQSTVSGNSPDNCEGC